MEGEDRGRGGDGIWLGELVMGDFMTSNNGGKATNKGPVKSVGHPEAQPRNTGRELLIVESTATQKQIDNDESAAPPPPPPQAGSFTSEEIIKIILNQNFLMDE